MGLIHCIPCINEVLTTLSFLKTRLDERYIAHQQAISIARIAL